MNKYQVAIFDFDGTLCNSVAAITASIKETFKHFGLQEPKDTHIETVISNGVGILDSLKLLNPSLMCSDDITVTNWIEAYRATTSKFEKPLYNNVSKVLRGLKESGISCIIVSNNTVENITACLEKNGLADCISAVYGISEKYPLKPDPKVFLEHIVPNNTEASRTDFIMFGDTATDIQFAQNCGIDVCWVSYGCGIADDCSSLIPNYSIETPIEILPIILDEKSHITRED